MMASFSLMRLGSVVFLAAVFFLMGCGYRSVVSKGGGELASNERFAPFLIRNVTADVGLTHVVGTALRQELGRRDQLGARGEADLYEVTMTIRRVGQRAVAFAPNGAVIEYLGTLAFDYRIVPPGSTTPLVVVSAEPLWYRYHFRRNPHILQQNRDAALAEAVRSWVPKLLMQTSALVERHRREEAGAREATEPDHGHRKEQEEPDDGGLKQEGGEHEQ